MTIEKLNVVKLKDEDRIITIYMEDGDKFLVHFENINEMSEWATEFSFEGFVKTYRMMRLMIDECIALDNGRVLEIAKMKKGNVEINRI